MVYPIYILTFQIRSSVRSDLYKKPPPGRIYIPTLSTLMPLALSTSDVVVLLCAAVVAGLVYHKRVKSSRPPYPPGPRRLPLIGNLLVFPSSFEWITYDRWCKEIGSDIIYVHVAGKDIIVLNSLEAIDDLFEKRSANYSSRPSFPMTIDLTHARGSTACSMGYDWLLAFMPYGNAWKERRRQFVQHFRPTDTSVYQDNQIKYVREILPRLLDDPENFIAIARHAVAASAISLAYGLPIKRTDDPLIELAEHALSTMNASVLQSNFLVNVLPFLKYVPEFLPGTGFKAKAREWKKLQEDLVSRPFEIVQQQMTAATAKPSFTTASLQRMTANSDESKWDHERQVIKETAGSIFIGE
ncbi:hypothetical protein D9613_005757 [Agrocybe pediades]|uniref:Cytochrome P450 n=1 Tax=Agrocybe pediades TaxID=84607 RepID=A0A8H4QU56_9AGAR|nr:hypothetical protein D9613_005757 [Agrocybe pediades]